MALFPVQVRMGGWGGGVGGRASPNQPWPPPARRYVPVGLLERLPQRINERPPYYLGRDYLETLMASQRAADWIRIRCPRMAESGWGAWGTGVARAPGLTPPPSSQ